ncbi:hypothetical protein TWF696_006917 [Orbilia brochopaga]|uniref:LysM domain-containing protein n=1 Tax=Orbilia brochopaga TaxID=3140254 RepID=A0AAV9URF3_9PEZI
MISSTVLLSLAAVAHVAFGIPVDTPAPASPNPREPDMALNCNNWIQGFSGDNCHSLAAAANIPESSLTSFNPALARNCDDVKDGWEYCISIAGSAPAIPTNVGPKPTPTPFVRGPALPEQFPPKKGQKTQCIRQTTAEWPPFTVLGADLNNAIRGACAKILPGGSKFLDKGNAYGATAKLSTQLVYFNLKIWQGGFTVQQDLCVKHLQSVLSSCHFGDPKPTGTFGGCAYTEDGNFQACVFPSIGRA